MFKKLTISIAAMLLIQTAVVSAKTVDETTAKTVGMNFLIEKGIAISNISQMQTSYVAQSQVNGAALVAYYVFNVADQNAFVMVSADDIIIPILAYSNEKPFNLGNLSPSTKDWIEGYQNQINAAILNAVPPKTSTAGLWDEFISGNIAAHHKVDRTTSVAPLVSTEWDQYNGGAIPYDAYCPNTSTTSGLSVTGCVATAMSQVMKFWNWPTVGCGYHTYFDTYISSQAMGSNTWNSANFGNTVYDWAAMPLTSSNAAVATLMYHAGVSVDMSYSANESGAYVTLPEAYPVNCAEYALRTYFHYNPHLKSLLREGIGGNTLGSYYVGQDYVYCNGSEMIDSMVESTWISTLQTELSAGRPMLYEGEGIAGGHCWVCDGWESSTGGVYFHFNWGWSGASDGFYTVDNLAPPALGTGGGAGNFNYDQGVVMGIYPDSFASNPGSIELLAHITYTNTTSPQDYGTPFTLSTKILNSGSTSFTGDFCAQIFDTGNNLVATTAILSSITIAAGDSSAVLSFADSNATLSMIPVSTPYIRICYRPTGTTTWTPVANNGNFINTTILDVMNDTDVVLWDSLHVGAHMIAIGSPITVTTTLGDQDYGGSNFSGSIRAILLNVATADTFVIQTLTGQNISNFGSINVSFTNSSVSVPAGTYALMIQHQYGGSGKYFVSSSDFYPNPILIGIGAPLTTPTLLAGDVAIYPNPANNNVFIDPKGIIINSVQMFDVTGKVIAKEITPNGNAPISVSVEDLAPGIYLVQVQTPTGTIMRKLVINP